MEMRARFRALWLLALFLLAQAAPLAAMTLADGMSGMACCRRGSNSCCRRKPMQQAPMLQAGHPCPAPCAGTPTLTPGLDSGGLEELPATAWTLPEVHEEWIRATRTGLTPGYDRARFQRPPPVCG